MTLPVPWTYTNLSDFDNCPHKYYRKHVKKDLPKEPPSEAMTWGISVHEAMEKRLRDRTPLPETMLKFEPLAAVVERLPGIKTYETKVAINVNWTGTRFFGDDVFGRGKIDVLVVPENGNGLILDWKTGKKREDPFELMCFALMASKQWNVQNWKGAYVWLQDMKLGQMYDLNPDEAMRTIEKRTQAIEENAMRDHWPKHDNPLCGWCPVHDCEFNRSKT